MTQNKASSIKNWIKVMGFKLSKSHVLASKSMKIKYYTLDNFGIYEEIPLTSKGKSSPSKVQKFVSWTPWGVDLEIHSVKELNKVYEEFVTFNPNVALN